MGPLAEKAIAFITTMSELVSDHDTPDSAEYWAPLESFVAVDDFRRAVPPGTFGDDWGRDTMDWSAYLDGFRQWRATKPTYHNVVTRIAEFDDLVYLEIDEHHGDRVFHSLSTYEFNSDGQIIGVRVASQREKLTVQATSDL
jgi:hypothetical protein